MLTPGDEENKYGKRSVIPISSACAKNVARSLLPRWLRRRGTSSRYILLALFVLFFIWKPKPLPTAKPLVKTTRETTKATTKLTTKATTTSRVTSTVKVTSTLNIKINTNEDLYKSYQSEQSDNENRVQNLIVDSFEKTNSEFAPFLKELEAKELHETKMSEKKLLDVLKNSMQTPQHVTRQANGKFDLDEIAKILNQREIEKKLQSTAQSLQSTAKLAHYMAPTTVNSPTVELTDIRKFDRSILPDDLSINLASSSPYFNETMIKEQIKLVEQRADYVDVEMPPNSKTKIPNVVHYIWFGCHDFKIHHYLSVLSAVKVQQPEKIFFHTNCKPTGSYFPNVERYLTILYRSPPTEIWGKPVLKVEHQSDVARLEVLMQYGGIYVDDDVIILKKLDALLNHTMVLGEENNDALANTVILSEPGSWFLKRWYWEYRENFDDEVWSHHSCFVPWSLWHLFPESIYVQIEKMVRPNWEELTLIYRRVWFWQENYTIHLYSRFMPLVDKAERTVEELKYLNTTYGQIARFVLFGSERLWKLPN